MEKLTAQDLMDLRHGDSVYQFKGIDSRRLHFVGKMPKNENYLIFCDGQHLEFLYIDEKTGVFKHDWYSPTIPKKEIAFVIISKIDMAIERLAQDRENVKDIYFKK
jgi:hypothetical protein